MHDPNVLPESTRSELDQYDYELPRELIAQHPLTRREDARLMVVDRRSDTIHHAHVRDLPDLLDPRDALVLNDTKVIPARLVGYRLRTHGRWFGLYLGSDENGRWRLLCKTRGRLAPGETIMLQDFEAQDAVRLKMVAPLGEGQWLAEPEAEAAHALEILQRVGRVPLPHYIRDGEMMPADRQTYQTVFAEKPGAVAAPTAGLHFTEPLLERVEQKGLAICRVTLHVGIGTFRPIKVQRLSEHQMHREWGCIDPAQVQLLQERRAAGGRIVAVGTTSVRVLESAAASGELRPWQGETDLFIRPPYRFRAVDVLMTNFHLPRSTLLVLVRTFGGDALMRRAYEEAIEHQYRFFSYGDAMLIV